MGQLVSTSLEALQLEADVQSYPTCSNRLILKTRENAHYPVQAIILNMLI